MDRSRLWRATRKAPRITARIDELAESLDPDIFWRPHRSYLVNINHIKEVVPWFKSSYMLKMNDKRASEIPVSRGQTKRLRELLKL